MTEFMYDMGTWNFMNENEKTDVEHYTKLESLLSPLSCFLSKGLVWVFFLKQNADASQVDALNLLLATEIRLTSR